MRAQIASIDAREVLDCRMEPTLRVTVRTPDHAGTADVPAGRSTGKHEAAERRDGGRRYRGKGVRSAISTVEDTVAPALSGMDVNNQRAVDRELVDLDGTPNKERLGGNVVTGVSLATLKAGAACRGVPLYRYVGGVRSHRLPIPFMNMIEGGELAATDLDFQEHQLVPVGAETFADAVRMSAEVYYELGDLLADEYGESSRNVGVEGGYTPPNMDDPRDAFDALLLAAEECGYEGAFVLSIDAAASHLYDEQTDTYAVMGSQRSTDQMRSLYEELVTAYPFTSIEDPLHEDDIEGVADLTADLNVQIVGDDLFVTNPERIRRGVERGAANALLLKVNQVGTVTEAREAAEIAQRNGYAVQISERSGQTADTWLADLAVGFDADQIKTGMTRSERTEQYNRLLGIAADLDEATSYASRHHHLEPDDG